MHRKHHDNQKSYFSKDLNRKLLYTLPLLIKPVKTVAKKEGGQSAQPKASLGDLSQFANHRDETTRLRFLFMMHKTFANSGVLLRRIYKNADDAFSFDRKQALTANNNRWSSPNDVVQKYIDDNTNQYMPYAFALIPSTQVSSKITELYKTTTPSAHVIIAEYDTASDKNNFINTWYSATVNPFYIIDQEFKKAGFTSVVSYRSRYDPDVNPDFTNYVVYKK